MAETEKKRIGRPKLEGLYNEEDAKELCLRIQNGQPMVQAMEEIGLNRRRVYEWLDESQSFREMYARARQNRADYFAELVNDKTELMLNGKLTPEQCRVANDAYKWQASKLRPDTYGDKLNVSGSQGLTINIIRGALPSPDAISQALDAEYRDILED